MCRRNIRLIFLNACETGQGGKADFNRGISPSLLQAGVPAVVGNQYSVLDVSARRSRKRFYWALAQGRSLGDAAREARVAVNYLISGEAIDWAVPVLFARDPTEVICGGAPARPAPARSSLARREAVVVPATNAGWSRFGTCRACSRSSSDSGCAERRAGPSFLESVRIPAPLAHGGATQPDKATCGVGQSRRAT